MQSFAESIFQACSNLSCGVSIFKVGHQPREGNAPNFNSHSTKSQHIWRCNISDGMEYQKMLILETFKGDADWSEQ